MRVIITNSADLFYGCAAVVCKVDDHGWDVLVFPNGAKRSYQHWEYAEIES